MKNLLLGMLAITFLTPLSALADIAPDPGFHDYNLCAYIDNLEDFPDYDIYVTKNWRFGPSATLAEDPSEHSNEDCGSISEPIFAIKSSNQENITHEVEEERGDIWDILPENEQYFINASVTGSTTFNISENLVNGYLPFSNPTVSYVSVFHIDNLTDESFDVHLVSKAEYDENGQILSSTLTEEQNSTNSLATILTVAAAGLGIVLLLLAAKKWNK